MSLVVDLPDREPWMLLAETELLKKLDSIFTGEGGRKALFLSLSATTCIDFRTLQKYEMKGEVNVGLLER